MTDSILVVEFSVAGTTAAVVSGGQYTLIPEPTGGTLRWPPAALTGPDRADPAWLAQFLTVLAAHGASYAGAAITQVTLIIPGGGDPLEARQAALTEPATLAGFLDVELVSTPAAAVADAAHRTTIADGSLVLVCDLDAQWTVSLVRISGGQAAAVAEETSTDLPDLAADGRETTAALRWLATCAERLVTQAGLTWYQLSLILVVGALAARVPAESALSRQNGPTVLRLPEPDLAVIRGAVTWAAQAERKQLAALPPTWRDEPLTWDVPGGARLLRWLVAEGQSYPAGALLCQVRTSEGRIVGLTASAEGTLARQSAAAGAAISANEQIGTARTMAAKAQSQPTRRYDASAKGDWLLTPNRRYLVSCADGAVVTVRSAVSGVVVRELRPAALGHPGLSGRVFINPDDRPTLVSWGPSGQFLVWDVDSALLLARFKDHGQPRNLLVDESRWQMIVETDRTVQVGRYQRGAATIWDLRSGQQLETIVGDLQPRQLTGHAHRSRKDGFGEKATSPDGRYRAETSQAGGQAVIAVHDEVTGAEVLRIEQPAASDPRVGFSADSQSALVTWHREDGDGWLEVWNL